MPIPDLSYQFVSGNCLLYEELSYDRDELKREHDSLVSQLTEYQKYVYDTVLGDVKCHNGGLYFLYGYGGTSKTFVWKTLSAAIRSKGDIVLNVASSGIASLLMPGGRTVHTRFVIPIQINEDSTCNIAQGSDPAELIIKCKLIIWDEAPMMHKHLFEALDRTMRDLMRFENVLSGSLTIGGKTVVLGDDFRQILPVIPKGSRQDIVGASINSSYLWNSCKVLRLTKISRLQSVGDVDCRARTENFANWIAAIGDGEIGVEDDGHTSIDIPKDNLLQISGDPIEAIVNNTFPMFLTDSFDMRHLNGRAILAPTLDVINEINQYMRNLNPMDGKHILVVTVFVTLMHVQIHLLNYIPWNS
ncbi:uncharacterized protein LOC116030337 [Ipomoea triloba]|uniref:uncharacterized protein LOC116030337 n=1 Tax=Ipomoea triloba TaxID=35885 RepID=UPI00125E0D74|nr:uncharacterized protein LOC116030337 [Ipomoea triloba]